MPEPDVEAGLTQAAVLDALDAMARMAEALLSAGASAADVTALTLRAAAGAGLTGTQIDINYTAVIVSTVGADAEPLTAVRVVKVRASDYSRLSALYDLAHAAADGLPPAEVATTLRTGLLAGEARRG